MGLFKFNVQLYILTVQIVSYKTKTINIVILFSKFYYNRFQPKKIIF